MRIGKYPFPLVGDMDETPAFLDMVPSKCTAQESERERERVCQPRQIDKCFHPRSFLRENLNKLSVI